MPFSKLMNNRMLRAFTHMSVQFFFCLSVPPVFLEVFIMLNVFNLNLVNQYNYKKAEDFLNSNYRERINSQIRDKIKKAVLPKKLMTILL